MRYLIEIIGGHNFFLKTRWLHHDMLTSLQRQAHAFLMSPWEKNVPYFKSTLGMIIVIVCFSQNYLLKFYLKIMPRYLELQKCAILFYDSYIKTLRFSLPSSMKDHLFLCFFTIHSNTRGLKFGAKIYFFYPLLLIHLQF